MAKVRKAKAKTYFFFHFEPMSNTTQTFPSIFVPLTGNQTDRKTAEKVLQTHTLACSPWGKYRNKISLMNCTLASRDTDSMLGGRYRSRELKIEGLKSNCRSSYLSGLWSLFGFSRSLWLGTKGRLESPGTTPFPPRTTATAPEPLFWEAGGRGAGGGSSRRSAEPSVDMFKEIDLQQWLRCSALLPGKTGIRVLIAGETGKGENRRILLAWFVCFNICVCVWVSWCYNYQSL